MTMTVIEIGGGGMLVGGGRVSSTEFIWKTMTDDSENISVSLASAVVA